MACQQGLTNHRMCYYQSEPIRTSLMRENSGWKQSFHWWSFVFCSSWSEAIQGILFVRYWSVWRNHHLYKQKIKRQLKCVLYNVAIFTKERQRIFSQCLVVVGCLPYLRNKSKINTKGPFNLLGVESSKRKYSGEFQCGM